MSHVRVKVKVVLELTIYATKTELKHAGDADRKMSWQTYFIDLKAEVDKLNNNDLGKVPTGLNESKTRVDHLDAVQLKSVSLDLKKKSNAVDK